MIYVYQFNFMITGAHMGISPYQIYLHWNSWPLRPWWVFTSPLKAKPLLVFDSENDDAEIMAWVAMGNQPLHI